jgi:hypothetical protein
VLFIFLFTNCGNFYQRLLRRSVHHSVFMAANYFIAFRSLWFVGHESLQRITRHSLYLIVVGDAKFTPMNIGAKHQSRRVTFYKTPAAQGQVDKK